MAACVHTSRVEPSKKNLDLDCSQFYCRPNFCDLVSCVPICPNSQKSSNFEDDNLWVKMIEEAKFDVDQEPTLSNYYYNSILSHTSLDSALATQLANKLSSSILNSKTLFDLFLSVLLEDREIVKSVKEDLKAVKERDPACISYVHCFLNFKGFLAIEAHRISHRLWSKGRKIMALLIQNRVSEIWAVDIHPGARIGRGILLDHATGVVIGETAVIGDNVSILHNVTLGGTGKIGGDRHPKIGDGVLIGAGTCVLGNIKIGDYAKIGAASVVVKEIPERSTAVGNPARVVRNPNKVDQTQMLDWSDYMI